MFVDSAAQDFVTGALNQLRLRAGQVAQLFIRQRSGFFQQGVIMNKYRGEAIRTDGEVLQ